MRVKTWLPIAVVLAGAGLWAYSQSPREDRNPTPLSAPAPTLPPSIPEEKPRPPLLPTIPPTTLLKSEAPPMAAQLPNAGDDVPALMKALADLRAERTRLDKREQETIQLIQKKMREKRQALKRLEEDLQSVGIVLDETPPPPVSAAPSTYIP